MQGVTKLSAVCLSYQLKACLTENGAELHACTGSEANSQKGPFGCIHANSRGLFGGVSSFIFDLEHNHCDTIGKLYFLSLIHCSVITNVANSLYSLVSWSFTLSVQLTNSRFSSVYDVLTREMNSFTYISVSVIALYVLLPAQLLSAKPSLRWARSNTT